MLEAFGWDSIRWWIGREAIITSRKNIRRLALCFTTAFVITVGCLESAGADKLELVDGSTFEATLEKVDSDSIQFQIASETRTYPVARVDTWGCRRVVRSSRILFADESILIGSIVEYRDSKLKISSSFLRDVVVSADMVRGWIVSPPTDDAAQFALERSLLVAQGSNDQILLVSGDKIDGNIEKIENEIAYFRSKAIKVEIPLGRIRAVRFGQSDERKTTEWKYEIGLRDGSIFYADDFSLTVKSMTIVATLGAVLQSHDAVRPVRDGVVCMFRRKRNDVVYLSDIPNPAYRHRPFLSLKLPLGVDQNVLGSHLQHGECLYSKGLGMPSGSRVVFDLNATFDRFETKLGIDQSAGDEGAVIFRVLVNDGSWRQVYRSETVRGGQALLPLSLPVRGAKQLALAVDYGDRADVKDYANWIDARLIKTE